MYLRIALLFMMFHTYTLAWCRLTYYVYTFIPDYVWCVHLHTCLRENLHTCLCVHVHTWLCVMCTPSYLLMCTPTCHLCTPVPAICVHLPTCLCVHPPEDGVALQDVEAVIDKSRGLAERKSLLVTLHCCKREGWARQFQCTHTHTHTQVIKAWRLTEPGTLSKLRHQSGQRTLRKKEVYTHRSVFIGLARTIYIRCIYGIFWMEITKYTIIYGAYIRFWSTLCIHHTVTRHCLSCLLFFLGCSVVTEVHKHCAVVVVVLITQSWGTTYCASLRTLVNVNVTITRSTKTRTYRTFLMVYAFKKITQAVQTCSSTLICKRTLLYSNHNVSLEAHQLFKIALVYHYRWMYWMYVHILALWINNMLASAALHSNAPTHANTRTHMHMHVHVRAHAQPLPKKHPRLWM